MYNLYYIYIIYNFIYSKQFKASSKSNTIFTAIIIIDLKL